MTYRESMSELAATLARTITASQPIPEHDLDVALTGYQATIDLLRGIHRDLTGSSQHATPRLVSEAERNPVGLLGTLLADIPRLAPLSPTEALTHPARSGAGARWQQITRDAVLAAGAWDAAGPAGRPSGAGAWTELADVAALAQGVVAASDDLAGSLARAGRLSEADAVRMVRQSGLGVAAEHTGRRAATASQQPTFTMNLPHGPATTPLLPRGPHDLPEAFRRLTELLHRAAAVAPRDVELIALSIATAAHIGSQSLTRTGVPQDAALAVVLHEHAELLARAHDTTRRLATITATDPRPVAQAQAIHQLLAGMRRTTAIPAADVVRGYAAELTALTTTLDDVTRRHLDTGRWLTPLERQTVAPSWGRADRLTTEPRLVQQIRGAAEHLRSPSARRVLPTATLGISMAPRPQQALRATLAAVTPSRDAHLARARQQNLGRSR